VKAHLLHFADWKLLGGSHFSLAPTVARASTRQQLLLRWKGDEDVVPASEARKLEDRVRELERLLGRKTMEVEILKEALDLARTKNRPCCRDRQVPEIRREDRRRQIASRPFQHYRTARRLLPAARSSEPCW
jgi:hypothetical protein